MNTARADLDYFELVKSCPLVPIRNQKQFGKAVKMMKDLAYHRTELSRAQSDYLSVLGDLITQYEERLPKLKSNITPAQALKYLIEVNQLTQADLAPLVGHHSNLSAFLSGKRQLSKTAVLRLSERFKVSPTLFLPQLAK